MVRVRFAPSPTGHLHVGGVRTALFNWLFAKKHQGTFVLRVEDTDENRSTREFEQQIFDSLRWCGLDWDEGPEKGGDFGPYRQSERIEAGEYSSLIERLLASKQAYYVVYDLDDEKKEIETTYDYPARYAEKGHSITVKFKVPEGKTEFKDLLRGDMAFDNENYDDFIIQKSNGKPLYNFVVVADDHAMQISHVFRGEDHITNTPKQVMLYMALGWEVPLFMHIPLLLGDDKSPLSKRHGGTSVAFFRKEGYLRDGLMNYLALLGWTVKDEIFNPFENVEQFSISDITNKSVVFDYKKLEWVNGKQMRLKDPRKLREEWTAWLEFMQTEDAYYSRLLDRIKAVGPAYTENVIAICREKLNTFPDLNELVEPFFFEIDNTDEGPGYTQQFVKKFLAKESAPDILKTAYEEFEKLDETAYSVENVEQVIRTIPEKTGHGKKRCFQTIRGAVTGRLITPGLFDTIRVLGKKRVLKRLKMALKEVETLV